VVLFEVEDFNEHSADMKTRLLAGAHADVRTALESANIDTSGLEFSPHPGGAQIVLPTNVEQTRLTDSCLQVLGARLETTKTSSTSSRPRRGQVSTRLPTRSSTRTPPATARSIRTSPSARDASSPPPGR
jgi:hypothetical protein